MSHATRICAGIMLLTVITIELGGNFMLRMLTGKLPGKENQTRYSLFRAGHAHAGVLVLLALIGFLYVDQLAVGEVMKHVVQICLMAAPIFVSAGFFAAGGLMRGEKVGGVVRVAYVGAVALAVALVVTGVGLMRTPPAALPGAPARSGQLISSARAK